MTARRLRAYPLPAKRSAAPSASDSKTRMHAACMVLANLLIILAPIRDVNVALIYARRSIVHRQLRLPQVSHDLYIFPTASATPTFLRLSEHSSSSNAVCHYCPHGTALHYDGLQLYYLPKRRLSSSASSTSTHNPIEDPGPKSLRKKFRSLFFQFLHVQDRTLLQPEQA